MTDNEDLPFAEALQADTNQQIAQRGWSADRAHARIRLLAGFVGLIGSALAVALLVMGAPAHG
jgi:hypothetical protein